MKRPPPLFSLGAVVRIWWRPRNRCAPWGCAAGALAGLSAWDWLARSGGVDFVLLGLAGYELILGMTE